METNFFQSICQIGVELRLFPGFKSNFVFNPFPMPPWFCAPHLNVCPLISFNWEIIGDILDYSGQELTRR